MSESVTIFVLDDDAAVRHGLTTLFRAAGFTTRAFASAGAFLKIFTDQVGCLVLDEKMPGMSGMELLACLSRRATQLPIVFLTAHGDVAKSVRAIKGGAVDFLLKPVNGAQLLARVRDVLAETQARQALWSRLTERERMILSSLCHGHASKAVAAQFRISVRTVEGHRANMMRKLGAKNAMELMNLAHDFGLAAVQHNQ